MGSTRSTRSNSTNQIDSRQIHETVNNIDQRLEDSYNTSSEIDIQDESQGNISAGGNVTVQSVEASIAASEALERIAEENRQAQEANAQALADLAAENRRIQDQINATQQEQARQQTEQASIFASNNSNVSRAAIEAAERVSDNFRGVTETALQTNASVVEEAFETNEANFSETVDLLRDDDRTDKQLFSETFKIFDAAVKDANDTSEASLANSFKSTVGGLADEQQQTLLIGLGIVAALLALMAWKKS